MVTLYMIEIHEMVSIYEENYLIFIFSEMTSKQLNEENSVKVDNTYKLLKKYIAVKQIIHTLGVSHL